LHFNQALDRLVDTAHDRNVCPRAAGIH
jgi:hypothetical protein